MSKFNFEGILAQNNQIKELPINVLVPYHNHQFKLYSGERLEDMVESIRKNGILNPILVQPIANGKYEILSGHNRVEGAKIIGLKHLPAIIKENLSEDEAEMYVIETNLMQRGFNDLLISEQATVLKARHSQVFSESKRKDIIAELKRLEGKENHSPMENEKKTALEQVGDEYGMSRPTVDRILRVHYLIQPFKHKIDTKVMALRVGVELSYIPENVQTMIFNAITTHNKKIDMKLSKAIRELYNQDNDITMETIENLIVGEKQSKDIKPIKVPLSREVYSQYFDKKTPPSEIADTLKKALDMYFKNKTN